MKKITGFCALFVSLLLSAGTIVQGATYPITGDTSENFALSAGDVLQATANAAASGTLSASGSASVDVGNGFTLTSSGTITGTTGTTLTKTGDGTWKVTGTNANFASSVSISAGTLWAAETNALGGAAVNTGENSTFIFSKDNGSAIVSTFSGSVSGTGVFELQNVRNWFTEYNGAASQHLSDYMQNFTGTLHLSGSTAGTRFKVAASDLAVLNNLNLIEIDNKSQFWTSSSNLISCDFLINGFGGFDGTNRGAFRLDTNTNFGGTITLGSDSSMGYQGGSGLTATLSGTIATDGHTLLLGRADGQTAASQVCKFLITGDVTSGAAMGTIQMNATDYSSASVANNVTLTVGNSAASASAVTQTFAANISNPAGRYAVTFQPGTNRTVKVSGVISGAGGVVKTQAGTLVLSGANTYSGGTTLSNGTLEVTNVSGLGTEAVQIDSGATLKWAVPSTASTNNLQNTITGTGTLYLYGNGNFLTTNKSLTTNLSGFTGTLRIGEDTRFRLDQSTDATVLNQLTGGIFVENGGQLWMNTSGTVTSKVTIAGQGWKTESYGYGAIRLSGNVTYSGGLELSADARIGAIYSGGTYKFTGLTETNGHTLTLQDYDGGTGTVEFSGGIQSSTGAAALGTLVITPGTRFSKVTIGNTTASESAATLVCDANITANAARITLASGANTTMTVAGAFTGSGVLTKAGNGTVVLTTGNFTGTTNIDAGTLKVTNNTVLGTGAIQIAEGAVLDWNVSNGASNSVLAVNLKNTFTGTGTLYLDTNYNMMTTGGTPALSTWLSGFEGTLRIGNNTRLRLDQGTNDAAGLANLREIIVESGGQLWFDSAVGTVNTKVTFAGTGWALEGNTYGAMRLSQEFTLSGGQELSANTAMTFTSNGTYSFLGGVETNGHTLTFNGGSGNVVLGGPISSGTATEIADFGTIAFTNSNTSTTLKITNLTDAAQPVQKLDVNLSVGARAVTFDAAKDYTLQLNGLLSGSGSVTKTGAGTLEITAANMNSGAVSLQAGTTRIQDDGTLGTGALSTASDAILSLGAGVTLQNSAYSLLGKTVMELDSASASTPFLEKNGALAMSEPTGEILFTAARGTTIQFNDSFLLVEAADITEDDFSKFTFSTANDAILTYTEGAWAYSVESLQNGNYGIFATASDRASLPEPSTWILLALGLVGIRCVRKHSV